MRRNTRRPLRATRPAKRAGQRRRQRAAPVKSGELLSEAFEAQGATSKIYTTTLLAGERSGNLEEVLGRYIVFQRITVSFRKKLIASLWYPALLICALVVMLTFLMTYVVPQFADLYSSLNAKLPAMTIFMLSIGRGIQNYYPYILGTLVAVALTISPATSKLSWSPT